MLPRTRRRFLQIRLRRNSAAVKSDGAKRKFGKSCNCFFRSAWLLVIPFLLDQSSWIRITKINFPDFGPKNCRAMIAFLANYSYSGENALQLPHTGIIVLVDPKKGIRSEKVLFSPRTESPFDPIRCSPFRVIIRNRKIKLRTQQISKDVT